jgi:hypothetical protein
MRARELWICSLIGLAALVPATASAQDLSSPKWTPWVELGGFYGSNDTSRGEAVLWVPLAQSHNSVLFGEARGKLFEDDMREGNFALGYRQMQANGWNYGLWGGYDIRRSEFGNTFHQLAGGIEALSDRWDFRANAYLPLNDSENLFRASSIASTGPVLEFTGSTIGLVTTTTTTTTSRDELALWGFDAEIGAKIFSTPLDLSGPRHELRVYAGAYHFDHSDLPDSVTGPRVRAEWRMDDVIDQWAGSRLTLEAEYSHDQLRDDRVEVGARLRLPFGDSGTRVASRSLTAQERRMADGLERDTDIVTDAKTTSSSTTSTSTEAVEDAATGVRFDRVATVDGTGSLTATSASAGANSLVIADGSAGNIVGAQTLQGDQTLQGGGSTIQVRGVTSGIVVDFTATGSRPTFVNTADSAVLTVAGSNTNIAGVDVEGAGTFLIDNYGISGTSVTNIRIDAVNIANTGLVGIGFADNSSVSISNSFIAQTASHGIFGFQSNTFTVSNTTIVDVEGTGIYVDENSDLTVSDIEIRNAGANGLLFREHSTVRVSRMIVDNAGGNGIVAFDNSNLTLNDSVFNGAFGNAGIRVTGPNVTFSGTGNAVELGTTFINGFCIAPGVTGTIAFNLGNCP